MWRLHTAMLNLMQPEIATKPAMMIPIQIVWCTRVGYDRKKFCMMVSMGTLLARGCDNAVAG